MVVAATAVEAWAPVAATVVVIRPVRTPGMEAMVVVVVTTLLVAGSTMAVSTIPYRPSATLRVASLA
jgi:hypothetical protein